MGTAGRRVEALLDFTSRVLYTVLERRVSHDRAFQETLSRNRRLARLVPLKVLYRVSRSVISSYYTLRYAERVIYGGRGGTKRLTRLWLVFRADPELLAPLWDEVERLRRKVVRSMPRRVESLEELLEGIEDPVERIAVKESYPRWFVETLAKVLPGGLGEVEELLRELNVERWWIRVNTLKADVDSIAERLAEKGVVVRRDPDLPYMLEVLDYETPLYKLEEMWRGEIIFQDKASAMVVEALEPEPNDLILDVAAAPGVKATLVAQLTENRARMVLVDVSWERLKRTQKLLRMYGVDLTKVDLIQADSRELRLNLTPTKAIVDAPCSSSGTIGRDPAVKMHLEDPSWVQQFPEVQRSLVLAAAAHDPQTIVYATCSLLPQEGELNVEWLLSASSRISVEEPPIPGSLGYPVVGFNSKLRRMHPHLHRTQGFFIARLATGG